VTEKDWSKIDSQESDLRAQLEAARLARNEALERERLAVQAAFAREDRLAKQLQFLEERKREMLRRELSSIEELEQLEREEMDRSLSVTESPQQLVPCASAELSDLFLDWGNLSPGAFGETVRPTPGNPASS
jgi:hypothetical protein